MARDVYQKLVTKFPQSELLPVSELEIGNTYLFQGDYDKAMEIYNSLIEKNKTGTLKDEIDFRIGFTFYKEGEFSEAEEKFMLLKEKKTANHDEVLYYLGWSFFKQKKYDESLSVSRKLFDTCRIPRLPLKFTCALPISTGCRKT